MNKNIKIKRDYFVYKHTSPNGKCYIGITKQKPESRWGNNGCGYKHNIYFTNAIKKYGWDNIKHEVLFKGLTKEEAEQKEIELIALYRSNNRYYGYNIDNGGNCICKTSDETRKKLSESHKGEKCYCYGKHFSEEHKRKIGKAHKGKLFR